MNPPSCAPTAADYPRESLRAGEEGVARIRVSIDAEGKIASMQVARSSGFAALDEASMKKLSQCKFRPGRDKNGNPVGGTTEVEYRWMLQKN
jgi:periplasmic protein TonB